MYWEAITMIEAQNLLMEMKVGDFPNMKKEDRGRLHRSLYKQAYPESAEQSVTTASIAQRLRMAAHGK